MIPIRRAAPSDREAIRHVYLSAFPAEERQAVATLGMNLLNETTTPETISLIAEREGEVAGAITFSPVTSTAIEDWQGYLLAPLAVGPEHQGKGVGSTLIRQGMQQLTRKGMDMLFVYGDPAYYGRFGFQRERASKYEPPYRLQYPQGWQATALRERNEPEATVPLSCVASLRVPSLW